MRPIARIAIFMTLTSTSRCQKLVRRLIRPQFLDIVEIADFRAEDVDDHVARIDQNPIGMRQALDLDIALTCLPELDRQLIGDGAHMPIRSAGGHDHPVGESRFAVEIDGDDVFRLGVFKLGENGFEELCLLGALGRSRGFRRAFRRSGFLRLSCQGLCPLVTRRSA